MTQRTTGERKVAKLFQNGGSQAVQLPAEFRFDADEVYVSRNERTGDVTLSSRPKRNVWKEFIDFRDSLDIPQEDLDNYMADRPMNQPVNRPSVFADEE
jgi:antitoxin VapB